MWRQRKAERQRGYGEARKERMFVQLLHYLLLLLPNVDVVRVRHGVRWSAKVPNKLLGKRQALGL